MLPFKKEKLSIESLFSAMEEVVKCQQLPTQTIPHEASSQAMDTLSDLAMSLLLGSDGDEHLKNIMKYGNNDNDNESDAVGFTIRSKATRLISNLMSVRDIPMNHRESLLIAKFNAYENHADMVWAYFFWAIANVEDDLLAPLHWVRASLSDGVMDSVVGGPSYHLADVEMALVEMNKAAHSFSEFNESFKLRYDAAVTCFELEYLQ